MQIFNKYQPLELSNLDQYYTSVYSKAHRMLTAATAHVQDVEQVKCKLREISAGLDSENKIIFQWMKLDIDSWTKLFFRKYRISTKGSCQI